MKTQIAMPSTDLFGLATSARIKGMLDAFLRDTLLPAMEQERAHRPRCKLCGRPLTSAKSVERGYGPACDKRSSADLSTAQLF